MTPSQERIMEEMAKKELSNYSWMTNKYHIYNMGFRAAIASEQSRSQILVEALEFIAKGDFFEKEYGYQFVEIAKKALAEFEKEGEK